MLKVSLLMSAAIVTGAAMLSVPQASAKLTACDVDSRSEAILWANQNPTIGYIAACQGLRGS